MMPWFDFVMIGASYAALTAIAYTSGLHRGQRARRIKNAPMCLCEHSRNYHAGKGACHYQETGGMLTFKCGCQHYMGPEPLDPGYYAPEIEG